MHQAVVEGVMPNQVSYSGANFDIVTGILALVVLVVHRGREVPRPVAVAFAIVGSALLAGILGIAVASTPLFHAYGTAPEKLNTWVFLPPFILLPAALVATALVFQLVLARRLLADSRRTDP